jgi:hypothetical protein
MTIKQKPRKSTSTNVEVEKRVGRDGKPYIPSARAFRFGDDYSTVDPWIDALEALDKDGNKAELIGLMKSRYPLPREIRPHIADLLERYELKRPVGPPRKPSYTMSETDIALSIADVEVNELLAAKEWTLADAIEEIAEQRGIKAKTLRDHHAKQRRSQRKR